MMRVEIVYSGLRNKGELKFSNGVKFPIHFMTFSSELLSTTKVFKPLLDKYNIKETRLHKIIFQQHKLTYASTGMQVDDGTTIDDVITLINPTLKNNDKKTILNFEYDCMSAWMCPVSSLQLYKLKIPLKWVEFTTNEKTIRYEYDIHYISDHLSVDYPQICPQHFYIIHNSYKTYSYHTMAYEFLDKNQKIIFAIWFELIPGTFLPSITYLFPSIQIS